MIIQREIMAKMKEAGYTEAEVASRLSLSRQNVSRKLTEEGHRLASTLALADCISLRYRIVGSNDGKTVSGWEALIGAAKQENVSADTFEKMLDALGWKMEIYF